MWKSLLRLLFGYSLCPFSPCFPLRSQHTSLFSVFQTWQLKSGVISAAVSGIERLDRAAFTNYPLITVRLGARWRRTRGDRSSSYSTLQYTSSPVFNPHISTFPRRERHHYEDLSDWITESSCTKVRFVQNFHEINHWKMVSLGNCSCGVPEITLSHLLVMMSWCTVCDVCTLERKSTHAMKVCYKPFWNPWCTVVPTMTL